MDELDRIVEKRMNEMLDERASLGKHLLMGLSLNKIEYDSDLVQEYICIAAQGTNLGILHMIAMFDKNVENKEVIQKFLSYVDELVNKNTEKYFKEVK